MIFLNLLNKGKCLEMAKRGDLKTNRLITTDSLGHKKCIASRPRYSVQNNLLFNPICYFVKVHNSLLGTMLYFGKNPINFEYL